MKIDTLIKTYNRADLLPKAIDSYLAATIPEGVDTHLIVVDNNSHDDTRTVVQAYVTRHLGRIEYLFAPIQGAEHALHAGIVHSTADVIALFDDDEEVQKDWLLVLARNFVDPTVDYVSGEVRPNWLVPRPDWLPPGFTGAVGIVQNGQKRRQYGSPGFSAILAGGNAAIRRSALMRCKPWSECSLPNAEDRFMYNELERIGAVGFYDPALVLSHQVPAKRVTKKYYRFWALAEGQTNARVDRERPPVSRSLMRVPFWRWRQAVEALIGLALRRGGVPDRVQAELQLWEFWGYLTTVAGRSKNDHEYRTSLK